MFCRSEMNTWFKMNRVNVSNDKTSSLLCSIVWSWQVAKVTNMRLLIRIKAKGILEMSGTRFDLSQFQRAL